MLDDPYRKYKDVVKEIKKRLENKDIFAAYVILCSVVEEACREILRLNVKNASQKTTKEINKLNMAQVMNIIRWFGLIKDDNLINGISEITSHRNAVVHNYLLNVYEDNTRIKDIEGKIDHFLKIYNNLIKELYYHLNKKAKNI